MSNETKPLRTDVEIHYCLPMFQVYLWSTFLRCRNDTFESGSLRCNAKSYGVNDDLIEYKTNELKRFKLIKGLELEKEYCAVESLILIIRVFIVINVIGGYKSPGIGPRLIDQEFWANLIEFQ